jgi:hypothetical protein
MKIIVIQLFNTSKIKNEYYDYEKNNAKKQKTKNFTTFSKMFKKQKTHSMFQSFQELLKTTSISPSLKSNLVLIPYSKLIRHG